MWISFRCKLREEVDQFRVQINNNHNIEVENMPIQAQNAEKRDAEQRSKTAVPITGKVSQNSIFTVTENKKTT